mmetsp:Transcript_50386/g.140990  ORF Transcript_50386/g.140990 Transcript_50386/m.140990 type:complete len:201 (-) Transcript_50386:83-685(-)|eukprot:CAMPEP_0117529508 /NCGR_PEP_ID=MMETSP0784-20121206/37868_1 /TAXON_ID=39447 /ORGANISM="" /LENGTH=200 /DNA_ID=CAMNT_0005325831 /DNA_START=149 /DNA_END=751 /DNA_ORIENTATION=-
MQPAVQARRTAPTTDMVYVVCLVHFLLCIFIIAFCTPGTTPLRIGGMLVAPVLQWWNTTFVSICLVVIICAAVGNLYLIESHLDVYLITLGLGIVVDLMWFMAFLIYGESCETKHSSEDHIAAIVSCSISTGSMLVGVVLVLAFKVFAVWVVSKAKRVVRMRYNEDFLPYMRKSLNNSLSQDPMAEFQPSGSGLGYGSTM